MYAERQKASREVIQHANALVMDSTRMLGEMLSAQKAAGLMAKGTKGQLVSRGVIGGTQAEPPINTAPTLADVGLTKKESAQAQFIAKVAETKPEAFEALRSGKATVAKRRSISPNGIRRFPSPRSNLQRFTTLCNGLPRFEAHRNGLKRFATLWNSPSIPGFLNPNNPLL